MLRAKVFRPLLGLSMVLAGAGYALPALAGLAPPPPPSADPVDEQYPDSCLAENEFFAIDANDELVIDDGESTEPVTSETLASLNEDGRCSQLSAGSAVIGDDVNRLLLTEYFNRMGSALQNRILGGFFGGGTGVAGHNDRAPYGRAAGDGLADWGGWSPWVSYGHTMADNDLSSTRYDADQDNILFGMDYSYSDRLIFGISGGYENNDVDTAFNLGETEVTGLTIAPYAAYMLTDSVSIDAAVGYSDMDIDQFRTEPGGARVTGNTDASRWFVMSNLNTFHRHGNWVLTGRAGVIYSEEEQDAFTETGGVTAQSVGERDIEFGQLNIGGEVAYSVHSVEPFTSLFYQYDFERGSTNLNPNQAQPGNDDDDFRFAAGLRYFSDMGFSATLEYSKVIDRDNFDSDTFSLIGRMQF